MQHPPFFGRFVVFAGPTYRERRAVALPVLAFCQNLELPLALGRMIRDG
jgi:hypothetical protein